MSEDLAGQVRMGITFVLLSSCVSFIVSVFIVGTQQLTSVQGYSSAVISHMETATMFNVAGKTISGAEAYRICTTCEGMFHSFKIKIKGGSTYNLVLQLLEPEFINRSYYVNAIQYGDGGMWDVVLEEK